MLTVDHLIETGYRTILLPLRLTVLLVCENSCHGIFEDNIPEEQAF